MADVRRVLVVAAVLIAAVPAASSKVTAAPPVDCVMLHVQSTREHGPSTLFRVELPSGATDNLGKLGYYVNAIGYSKKQDKVYGIANRKRLVRIDRRGTVTDLGPVRGLHEPTAGTVVGNRLLVKDGERLHSIDITRRSVLHSVLFSSRASAASVHDFDVGPGGLLYGVSPPDPSLLGSVLGPILGFPPVRLVSIDPVNGKVRTVATLPQLPRRDSYTSVVRGSSNSLYAVSTGTGRGSRLFRIGFDGSVTELPSLPRAAASDAAGCLTAVKPPVPPPPPPPPTTQPPTTQPPTTRPPITQPPTTQPPTTQPPTTQPATSAPTSPPPDTVSPPPLVPPTAVPPSEESPGPSSTPTPSVTPSSTPSTVVPPGRDGGPPPGAAAMSPPPDQTVTVLRRWSLATLLLVLTAGAVATTQARNRYRYRSRIPR